MKNFVANIFW